MTAQDIARHIDDGGLTGYVRNSKETTSIVEGEVQAASAGLLDKFIAALEKSPAGRVDRVEHSAIEEVRHEGGFVIR